MNSTIFEKNLVCYRVADENGTVNADRESIQLYSEAKAKAYALPGREKLLAFLTDCARQQAEDGLIHTIDGDSLMPSDVKIGLWYEPSWAVGAAGIYAMLQWPESFDETLWQFLARLLKAGVKFGMGGHGIESYNTWRTNMFLFGRAGAADFLQKYPDFCPEFTKCLQRGLKDSRSRLQEAAEKRQIMYDCNYIPYPIEAQTRQILAAYEGRTEAVFVYGTLMQGQRANSLLGKAEYAGRFLLRDHALYDLGSYPAIQAKTGETAEGEVWFVPEEVIPALDRYEGEGSLYARRTVDVESDQGRLTAQAYVYLPEVDCAPMHRGWSAAESDGVWYACYGSNLSQMRFACYIFGGTCRENGKTYPGSRDRSYWKALETESFGGTLYFGSSSPSWNGKGVAFYDPEGPGSTQMRLYQISRTQLTDVQRQEGSSADWYGRTVCLGIKDNMPIYTLTSEKRHPDHAPDAAYVDLLYKALIQECLYTPREAKRYLKNHLPRKCSIQIGPR